VTKLVALDFDGVIADSAPEAFVVAARTFAGLRPAASTGARRPATRWSRIRCSRRSSS
jgi:hypothetical protein